MGGGGGKGDEKSDSKEKKEGEGDGEGQAPPQKPDTSNQDKKQKPKPKPFDGKDITQQDVNRILDELKNQEENIRAKMQKQGGKDAPNDKDW